MNFTCPLCTSDNIQWLSIIYNNDSSNINSESSGMDVGTGSGAHPVGRRTPRIKTRAKSAMRAVTTTKKPWSLLFIFIAFVAALLLFTTGNKFSADIAYVIWIIASIAWCVHAYQYDSKTSPPPKAIWNQSFLCNRCHAVFALPLDSSGV